jgi:hypothetical protein
MPAISSTLLALEDQYAQGLADRGPRDSEGGREGDLTQRRTGLQLTLEDRPPQLLDDPVDGRGVLEVERAERLGHARLP